MKPSRPFARETRPLPPSRYQHVVAAPDVIGEVRAIARDLQTSPAPLDVQLERAWRVRAGVRLEALAALIREHEPASPFAARPKCAVPGPRQLEMVLP